MKASTVVERKALTSADGIDRFEKRASTVAERKALTSADGINRSEKKDRSAVGIAERSATSPRPTYEIHMACDVRIGTSGWHYRHWRGPFYPRGLPSRDMLSWYARDFATVELNTTFYHLPRETSLMQWRDGTPADFCFAVKGSRYLTHMRKLNEPESGLSRFVPLVKTLGPKLGPILFQLPPRWSCNLDRLAQFLSALPTGHRYSFELRDPSWHVPEIYRLLERHNAAFCIYELAGIRSPVLLTADFTYVRLHGPGKAYQGSYRASTLRAWADRIRAWRSSLKAIYFYFDNDQAGYAPNDALRLRRLVETASVRRGRRILADTVAGV